MTAHLGRRVSQLLDGRLSPAETDAAWAHVHTCHLCRDDVEREGWVKTRLSSLSFDSDCAPDHLKGALLGMPPGDCFLTGASTSSSSQSRGGQHDLANRPRHARRAAGIAAIGGGAAGAAVLGVLALGTAPADVPTFERRQQQQPSTQVTPSPVTPRVPMRLPR